MASTARNLTRLLATATTATACMTTVLAQGWAPTDTVQFIVPAGMGGGADQMARMIQHIIENKNLMEPTPVIIINKSGRDGAGVPRPTPTGTTNKLLITLSNLFTTPLVTGIPFNYTDITPVAKLAMD